MYTTYQKLNLVYADVLPQFIADWGRRHLFTRTDPHTDEHSNFDIHHVGDNIIIENLPYYLEEEPLDQDQMNVILQFAKWVADQEIDWIGFSNPVNPTR